MCDAPSHEEDVFVVAEAEEDKELAQELRIACTLIGLFGEKAKKLTDEASDYIAELEMMLKPIQDN